ncbi:MAG: SHOCT domain-containing protein [Clostridiales bacterium]|nr:SHOCT domain-containing protein [Clostridiales bacterium]
MQSPYGQPGMSPQGQPYAPQGQAYIQAQPYAPQGQAYTQPGQPYPQPYAQPGMPQPYAAAPMVPQPYAANPTLFHNIATSREPSANEWKCSCGLINPNYTGTCACGQKKNSPTRRPPNMSGASAGSPAQPAAAGVPSNEVDKIKLIKEYKQLLDSGIISQEEFDAKKQELLR